MRRSSEFGESLDYFHWKFKHSMSDNAFKDLLRRLHVSGLKSSRIMARFIGTCIPCSVSKCANTIPASRIAWRSQGNIDCDANVYIMGKQDFMKEMKQLIMLRNFTTIST